MDADAAFSFLPRRLQRVSIPDFSIHPQASSSYEAAQRRMAVSCHLHPWLLFLARICRRETASSVPASQIGAGGGSVILSLGKGNSELATNALETAPFLLG
ncbi:uncharacterized protein [Aegilops tauschii subsp. strangulata]|uniref:uncharacterized protein n=1 Tax=Aegilops tauschii subsp. strangulata TaxID=200361 RepID=UPI003CC87B59